MEKVYKVTILSYMLDDGKEVGYFDNSFTVSKTQMSTSHDPKHFLKHQISQHLAGLAVQTGLPLGEGHFRVNLDPELASATGIPELFEV